MNIRNKIFEVADRQQGYFTAKQAQDCGIPRSHFHRKLRSGEWIKEQRGIYRLAHYPITDRPELVLWSLWSRDKKDRPQGVWSHETASDIHELCDIMPSKMHMTVPPHFRKQVKIPKILKLHVATISEKDVEIHQGYQITTPLKTLLDVIKENTISQELIIQAIRTGLQRGILLTQDVLQIPELAKYIHEYNL